MFLIGETRDLGRGMFEKRESTGNRSVKDESTKGIFGVSFAKLVRRFWSNGQVYCRLAPQIRNEEYFLRKDEKVAGHPEENLFVSPWRKNRVKTDRNKFDRDQGRGKKKLVSST